MAAGSGTPWQPSSSEPVCLLAAVRQPEPEQRSHRRVPVVAGSRREGTASRGCPRPWGTHRIAVGPGVLGRCCTLAVGGFRAWRASGRGEQGTGLLALTPLPNKGVVGHPKTPLLWGQGSHLPHAWVRVLLAPASAFPGPLLRASSGWQPSSSLPATHVVRKILLASVFTARSITLTGHERATPGKLPK